MPFNIDNALMEEIRVNMKEAGPVPPVLEGIFIYACDEHL